MGAAAGLAARAEGAAVINWLVAILAVGLWIAIAHGCTVAAQRDVAKAETAQLRAEIAAADAQARRRALETELRHAADMQSLAENLEKEQADAERKHAGVVAGLERGALRLRQQWQGCQARLDGMPADAPPAGIPDGGAALRTAGVASLLRVGSECDAKLRAWQQYARTVTGRE